MENKSTSSKFTFLYFGLVLVDIFIGSADFTAIRYGTKPLILLSLVLYFAYYGKFLSRSIYFLIILALIFSLIGDVLLLFDHLFNSFFIWGLIAFLIAHILYFIVFLKRWGNHQYQKFWIGSISLVAYGAVLFFILKDALADLKIPVIFYILGILAMAVSAYGRKGKVNAQSFYLVFIGALLFMVSDSILALNKFMFVVPWSHFLVMGTYASAQYLIVKGILKDSR